MHDRKYKKIDRVFMIEDQIKDMIKEEMFIDSSKQVA